VNKLIISMRYFLIGREYYKAIDAMEFAISYHTGLRKDGITPEFQHQVSIAHYLRTLQLDDIEERAIILAFTHDLSEPPYNISSDIISKKYGLDIGKSQWLITKKNNDVQKTEADYFNQMDGDLLTVIVKGADKINNMQTMQGVFDDIKQREHIRITRERVIPMLKKARRKFPKYESALENMKFVLNGQIELINHIHG